MSGHLAQQITLVGVYDDFRSAARAAAMFPEVHGQQAKADRLHAALTEIAFACGFAPGRQHRHLTVLAFAQQRAATLRRVFPNSTKEA